jgi:hypothetical protein
LNNTAKFILVFLGSSLALFLIFYFYPAEIFEAVVYGADGDSLAVDLSLKGFLFESDFPNTVVAEHVVRIDKKLSGWMIMFVCLIGLPLMFAYRSIVSKKSE